MANSKKTKKETNSNLTILLKQLSADRRAIAENLLTRDWFNKTGFAKQKELLTLTEDFNQFLEDLSNRPDEIGNVKVLKLLSF